MNWSRAKSILIIVFVLLNLFLLMTYGSMQKSKSGVDLKQTSEILQKNQITLKNDVIKKVPAKLHSAELLNLAADTGACAKRFLGEGYITTSETEFKKDGKQLLINRNMMEYIDNNPQDSSFQGLSQEKTEKKTVEQLVRLGMKEDTLECVRSLHNSQGQLVLTYNLQYKGYSVFNSAMQVTVSDLGITNIKGVLLAINESGALDMQYDIANPQTILLELLSNPELDGQTPQEIDEVNLGYYIPKNDFAISADAIPAYQIILKNGKIYYYDARVNVPNNIRLLAADTDISRI